MTTHVAAKLAWWVSIVGHPFVMVALLVGIAGARVGSRAGAVRAVALVTAAVLVPLGLLMLRQVRTGRWTNVDASRVSERPALFTVALVALGTLAAGAYATGSASFLVRGLLAAVGLMLLSAAVTPWVKASLHMAFAGLAGTALVLLGSAVGYAIIAALPVLAWSRLALSRHRPHELIIGLGLGACAGAALVTF